MLQPSPPSSTTGRWATVRRSVVDTTSPGPADAAGAEPASTTWDVDPEPLVGRLAPGLSVTRNDESVSGKRYSKKIVVTVQRTSDNFDLECPEFAGTIQ
ncbi:hypothetical protein GCM10009680_10610 [Streptomyces yatensis]|uniref:PASTA domain-containing protein n=1 Tax=Streptomyces yatensis TaxID=155177 RepID=A0ABN2GKG0_9ACTN